MTRKIAAVLYRLGANRAYIGFRYIVNCVELILEDEELQYYITVPYVDTAAKYHTSVKCVERDVRTLVHHIWKEGDREALADVAQMQLHNRPTSKAFLAMLAEYMRLEMERDHSDAC